MKLLRLATSLLCLVLAPQGMAAENQSPQKIIALAPHLVELLYSIGAGDQIIGTTDYADFPEAAENIPRVGSYAGLQVEKIVAMQPDMVLAWKTGNPVADLERLKKLGVPVVYSDIVTLEDVATELRRLGGLTGHKDTAEALADTYSAELQTLRKTYQGRSPVTVFYELWSRPLTTVARTAWPQQQLTLCGAVNPFRHQPQDYPQISLEDVLLKNPDVIIQPDHNGKTDIDGINWKRWPQLKAISNNRLIHPDADMAHRMTLRALDATRVLCEEIDKAR